MSKGPRKGPPESTQFKKGQSGNPRGRPKKKVKSQPSAFDIVIDRTLTITQNGKPREVTVDEALQHKTYQEAIAGNRSARREVLKMIAKREKEITKRAPPSSGVDLKKEGPDPRNADEALLILGIARRDPRWREELPGDRERLLLEPWAVEAALRRPGPTMMTEREISEARRCTFEPHTLKWRRSEMP